MPSRKEWQQHKLTISMLYKDYGLKLSDLMSHMASTHDFHAKENQYKRRFEEWDCKKNMKANEKQVLSRQKCILRSKQQQRKIERYERDQRRAAKKASARERTSASADELLQASSTATDLQLVVRLRSNSDKLHRQEPSRVFVTHPACMLADGSCWPLEPNQSTLAVYHPKMSSCAKFVRSVQYFINSPAVLDGIKEVDDTYIALATIINYNTLVGTLHLGYGDKQYGFETLNKTENTIMNMMTTMPQALFVVVIFLQSLPIWHVFRDVHRHLIRHFRSLSKSYQQSKLTELLEAAGDWEETSHVAPVVQDAIVDRISDTIFDHQIRSGRSSMRWMLYKTYSRNKHRVQAVGGHIDLASTLDWNHKAYQVQEAWSGFARHMYNDSRAIFRNTVGNRFVKEWPSQADSWRVLCTDPGL